MKLFLALLVLAGGYYVALCAMTDQATDQLVDLHDQYSGIAATADKWAAGDTSADFISVR